MKEAPPSKPTICLADDDPEDQELLTEAFQQLTDSHHLISVNSGRGTNRIFIGYKRP